MIRITPGFIASMQAAWSVERERLQIDAGAYLRAVTEREDGSRYDR